MITNERLLELAVLRDESQTGSISKKQLKENVEMILPDWVDKWTAFSVIGHRYMTLNPEATMEKQECFIQALGKLLDV